MKSGEIMLEGGELKKNAYAAHFVVTLFSEFFLAVIHKNL